MRRTHLFRLLASALAFWLPLVIGEPGLLQPCPTHGAFAAASAGMRAHAGHAVGHMGMSMPSGHQAPGHQHSHCTCIGCCCTPVAASLPDTPAQCPVAVVVEQASTSTFPTAPQLARPAPEFSRPHTTGPPLA